MDVEGDWHEGDMEEDAVITFIIIIADLFSCNHDDGESLVCCSVL